MYIYVVISQFTDSLFPSTHVSVYRKKVAAEFVAKKIGGIVLTRWLHWKSEFEDEVFKPWDDSANTSGS